MTAPRGAGILPPDPRTYLSEVKGLKLNVPNDLFNDYVRTVATAGGPIRLDGRAQGLRELVGNWLCVDGRIGVVGLYGGESITIYQAGRRRASGYGDSLYYDEVCFPCFVGTEVVTRIRASSTAAACSPAPTPRRRRRRRMTAPLWRWSPS